VQSRRVTERRRRSVKLLLLAHRQQSQQLVLREERGSGEGTALGDRLHRGCDF
jgi:hypothetical protein